MGGIREFVGVTFEVPEIAETASATTTANANKCFFISISPALVAHDYG